MPRTPRFDALFALHPELTDPVGLADAFQVHVLYWNVPDDLLPTLIAFRKLRQQARQSAARSYLKRQPDPSASK